MSATTVLNGPNNLLGSMQRAAWQGSAWSKLDLAANPPLYIPAWITEPLMPEFVYPVPEVLGGTYSPINLQYYIDYNVVRQVAAKAQQYITQNPTMPVAELLAPGGGLVDPLQHIANVTGPGYAFSFAGVVFTYVGKTK